MHISTCVISCLCWLTSLPLVAETTSYQTAPKALTEKNQPAWRLPLISVDPQTGKTRAFITPDGSFSNSLVSYGAPVYHARALYEPTPAGTADSMSRLHRQMVDTCPQGWIKLQEWANLQTDTPELHYQFQCLEP